MKQGRIREELGMREEHFTALSITAWSVLLVLLSGLTAVNSSNLSSYKALQRLMMDLKSDNSQQYTTTEVPAVTTETIESKLSKLLHELTVYDEALQQGSVSTIAGDYDTTTPPSYQNADMYERRRKNDDDTESDENLQLAKLLLKNLLRGEKKKAKRYKTVQYIWDYDPFGGGPFG